MQKFILATCLAIVLTFSAPALAAEASPGFSSAQGKGGRPAATAMSPEKFIEVRAEIAKRLGLVIENIQERKKCVEQAADPEALQICMPRSSGFGGRLHPGAAKEK
ncbi:MAG: hypothetical protein JWO78_74 [Micavibrio sp.]|nr:hypothetical protein [Micavibrio sp.]